MSFPSHADLAIECAPATALEEICTPMLTAGKQVMVLSAGALLPRPHLIALAREHGGQIIVPTGALLGLDAVCAAAEGTIHSVRMITRKPPAGLAGAPYLVEHGISVAGLNAAKLVFSGTAREAAAGFPANVNVVAALSLAGIGPDRTTIEIWADPAVTRNCHAIEVDADFGAVLARDREHPVGESQDRAHHRAVGDRGAAQAQRAAAGGDVRARSKSIARKPSAPSFRVRASARPGMTALTRRCGSSRGSPFSRPRGSAGPRRRRRGVRRAAMSDRGRHRS